jgi:hypothetical protein
MRRAGSNLSQRGQFSCQLTLGHIRRDRIRQQIVQKGLIPARFDGRVPRCITFEGL